MLFVGEPVTLASEHPGLAKETKPDHVYAVPGHHQLVTPVGEADPLVAFCAHTDRVLAHPHSGYCEGDMVFVIGV